MKIENIIRGRMEGFSETDKRIAKKLLNYKDFVHCDIHYFAKLCDTSSASIVRFSKKIGTKGFQDLKMKMALEQENQEVKAWNEGLKPNDNIEDITKKAIETNVEIFNVMLKNLDFTVLSEASRILKEADKIYIFGIGGSSLIAQDMQSKLMMIQKECVHIPDPHNQVVISRFVKPTDAVIAVSYSGESKEVINAVENSNTENLISITRMAANTLENHCNYKLHIPNIEGYIKLGAMNSRLCALALMDILYLSMINDRLEEVKQMIMECREIIQ